MAVSSAFCLVSAKTCLAKGSVLTSPDLLAAGLRSLEPSDSLALTVHGGLPSSGPCASQSQKEGGGNEG